MDSIKDMHGKIEIPTSELIPGKFIVVEGNKYHRDLKVAERVPCIVTKAEEAMKPSDSKVDGLDTWDAVVVVSATSLIDGSAILFSINEREPTKFLIPTREEYRLAVPYIA